MVHRCYLDLKFTLDRDSGPYESPRASPGGEILICSNVDQHYITGGAAAAVVVVVAVAVTVAVAVVVVVLGLTSSARPQAASRAHEMAAAVGQPAISRLEIGPLSHLNSLGEITGD